MSCQFSYNELNFRLNFTIVQSRDREPGLQRKYACWVFGADVIQWYPVPMCDSQFLGLRNEIPVANMTLSLATNQATALMTSFGIAIIILMINTTNI